MLASGALQFAFDKATTEGKLTIAALVVLSFFSWTIIVTKARQLYLAVKLTRKFIAAFDTASQPLEFPRTGGEYDGVPAFQVYRRAANEVERLIKIAPAVNEPGRMSAPAFEAVKAALEESAGALIATVVGLLVAIPAMFAYNFMVTTIRNLTQELDAFATRYAAQVSLTYVERTPA